MSFALGAWLYIKANRPNDILYVGTTVDLARRVWEHREGVVEGFTKRYPSIASSMLSGTKRCLPHGGVTRT